MEVSDKDVSDKLLDYVVDTKSGRFTVISKDGESVNQTV